LQQTGTINEYTHEWEVLATRFPDLIEDQLLKLYISGLKPIICNELRLSRPKNLVEARSMAKIIEKNLNTQHEVAFGFSKKTTNYSASGDYNTTKYHHSDREKKKENNCRKCGKNWTLGHRCEDMSLHYYRIVDGKQVEVSN
jgi:hypothetical protein